MKRERRSKGGGFVETIALKAEGASAQPFRFGHAADEDFFRFGLGLMFRAQAVMQFAKFVSHFIFEEIERLVFVNAKSVADSVTR